MKSPQFWTETEPEKVSSTAIELYIPTAEMARLLELSDNELTRLARSSVLVRQRDPYNSRAYLYPVWENVHRYVLHVRARREAAHVAFLEEKSRTQQVVRLRAELEMAISRGRLVDRERLFGELAKALTAFKQVLSSRAERLEQKLSRLQARAERVAVIQAEDADCLGLLDGLLKKPGKNGETAKAQAFPSGTA